VYRMSKHNDPLIILCTPCIQATVLKFKCYVVWCSGPLGTILHSCSFYVNLTVFEIFTKNHFNSGGGQYSRPRKNLNFDKILVHFSKKSRIT